MNDSDQTEPSGRGAGAPIFLVALGAFAAVNAVAWFYFRKRQPAVDEQTRDRLAPRRGA